MNIFAVSENTSKCAQYHVNKHVIKMQVESAQLLSTASYISLGRPDNWKFYKPTHENHPCAIWVRESMDNWEWLYDLAHKLQDEWRFRWSHDKNHKSISIIKHLPIPKIDRLGLTEFAQAVGNRKIENKPIDAYRCYYANDKIHIHDWGIRGTPYWLENYKER
jgi:Pyrimidine dimer DNA glycosylase